MSLPTNNKKGEAQSNKNQKDQSKGSKFIKGSAKPAAVTKRLDQPVRTEEVKVDV